MQAFLDARLDARWSFLWLIMSASLGSNLFQCQPKGYAQSILSECRCLALSLHSAKTTFAATPKTSNDGAVSLAAHQRTVGQNIQGWWFHL